MSRTKKINKKEKKRSTNPKIERKTNELYNKDKKSGKKKADALFLIKHIKSSYILKILFSNIRENKKLDMIKYNKEIQNHLAVNIDDYKNKSGRYIIKEKNGYGKEYQLNTNILVFEGEYSKGKRNGIGKEFEEGKIIFEGEYKNGKRSGEGYTKKYDKGIKIFEG